MNAVHPPPDGCRYCAAPRAPYGLRPPGPAKDIPVSRRGYVWHCGGEACRAKAEAEVNGKSSGSEGVRSTASEPPRSAPAKESAMDTKQPDLFAGGGQ